MYNQVTVTNSPWPCKHLRDDIDVEMCSRRQDVRRRLDTGEAADERADELGEAVQQVRRQLRGAIISEIGKERGMNFFLCDR